MKSARSSMARRKGNTDEAFGILQEIRDEVVFPEVLIFVGEILGEHKNAPVLVDGKWTYNVPPIIDPQDRNMIKRTLDVFRKEHSNSVKSAMFNHVLHQFLRQTSVQPSFSRTIVCEYFR